MTTTQVIKHENGAVDYGAYMGLEGMMTIGGMSVDVVVTGARTCYGRFDLCVEPKLGTGFRWVDHRKVTLNTNPSPSAVAVK